METTAELTANTVWVLACAVTLFCHFENRNGFLLHVPLNV